MKAAIYSSIPIGETGDTPKYNASAFPCHPNGTKIIFLNGHYPDIEALCKAEGISVKPFSEFNTNQPKKDK